MYVKLFADLLDSSLWSEDSDTRIVWMTLLLMSDQDGMVRAAPSAIANRARVVTDVTLDALERFGSPDQESRTSDHEGRRIEKVEGGYVILNYKKYRDLKTQEEQRAAVRERVRKHRERKRAEADADQSGVTDVTKSNPIQKHMQMQKNRSTCPNPDFDRFWEAYPRKVGKKKARASWTKAEGLPPIDALLVILEAHKKQVSWREENGKYIPHPGTWLNQARWEDDLTVEKPKHRSISEQLREAGL